ncbi:MoaF-related domain-containing protein [Amycolatopsis sp. NPDC102389]|uniref:MoaF-related domain-containing protein n=1 Tax=Amycolatopsis sp. NPDC102389 TaxID=3363941 RepID=UPI003800310A
MNDFPLTGQIWRIDYGEIAFEHDYRVPGKLSFVLPTDGSTMTVDLAVTKLRDNLYLLRFEDGGYASMVAIEDLAANTVNTTMFVHHDSSMMNFTGKISRIDA